MQQGWRKAWNERSGWHLDSTRSSGPIWRHQLDGLPLMANITICQEMELLSAQVLHLGGVGGGVFVCVCVQRREYFHQFLCVNLEHDNQDPWRHKWLRGPSTCGLSPRRTDESLLGFRGEIS